MPASTEQGTEAVTAAGTGAGSATASVHLGAANDANAAATWYYKDNECTKKEIQRPSRLWWPMPQPMPQTDLPPP